MYLKRIVVWIYGLISFRSWYSQVAAVNFLNDRNFLSNWVSGTLSRRILFHGNGDVILRTVPRNLAHNVQLNKRCYERCTDTQQLTLSLQYFLLNHTLIASALVMIMLLACRHSGSHQGQQLRNICHNICFNKALIQCWGTRWRSWLRHCATSRKVAGSIPDGVIGIFRWYMALESTQPLAETSTRSISWGVKPVRSADNLTTFMCRLSWNLGASTFWNPQGLFSSVMGLLYLAWTEGRRQ